MTDTPEISDEAERGDLQRGDYDRYGRQDLISELMAMILERDALKERVEKLEAALKPFADAAELYSGPVFAPDNCIPNLDNIRLHVSDLRRAREALAGKAAPAAQGGNDE